MKIAVLGHRRFPIKEPFAGGIEHFTHTLIKGLEKRGCQVTLFAHPDSDRSLNLSLEPILDTSFCINHDEESHEAYLNIMDYLSTQDFDLIHDNSLNYFPIILEDRLSAPLVTTLHTPPFARFTSAVRYRERKKRGHYISISKSNTKQWGLNEDRLDTIYNGVDTKVFSYAPFYHRNCAVWSGRIIPNKGTHLAIEAAQKAKMKLVIAGRIGDRQYFESKIKPHLGKTVEYVGHLKQKELVKLLQSAAMTLCTPVWHEPFGLVVIESLACGTPVVAFNRGAMSEILDAQTGIVVPPNDTDAMAQAMKQAKRLSRYSCRKLVLERFCIEITIDKYITTFQRIVSQHNKKQICNLATTFTSTVKDTLKEPEQLHNTSVSPSPSSALALVSTTGTE